MTTVPAPREARTEALVLLALAAIALVVSGIGPTDRGTWILEVFPVVIAAPLLYFTWDRFRLTPLAYRLIFVHALILMLGGHYTYAHVPLGFWLQDVFGFARNHYDRIGHFAQGFVPAILAREILLRTTPLRPGKMAVLPGVLRLPRDQRVLRVHRVVGGARPRPGRARVPRHAGRRVGHAVGHVHGPGRRDHRAGHARARPRSTARDARTVNAPETTLDRAAAPAARRPRAGRSRTALALRVEVVAAAALVLAALGWWTYAGVKASVEEVRATGLRALLDTEIAALDIWVDYSRRDALRAAGNGALAASAAALAAAPDAPDAPDAPHADAVHAELVDVLRALLGPMNAVAANVVARDGRLLATTVDSYRGLRLAPAVVADLAPVFGGATRFIAPRPERERLVGASGVALTRPIVWFAAPVRDAEGRVVAALQFGKPADVRFNGILGAARLDASGEAYAFDENGMMLTESRFADELKRLGLLHADAPGVALRFHVRDPGAALAAREDVPTALGEQPLTAPVRRAIASRGAADAAGRSGVILAPYRNYLGRETIGAYKWIADYDIGIAVEVDARDAFRPLGYLATTFWIIFALLVAATATALASSFSVLRLRRELRRLGQYRLLDVVGEGGSSTVYRAEHALLKRPTAVKVLKKHLATDEAIARFEREVRLASRLDHPTTIEIYDYGRAPDGTFYFAMEYLDGITLDELVERDGPQPVGRAALILLQICESLREAHGLGLVHRDIKPQNVMLCRRGGEADVVKVLDFGIAKDTHRTDPRDLTQYADVLGTPLYMAPERLRDPADADARADLYAVGVLAYLLLTGRRMFDAEYEGALIEAIFSTPAPRASGAAPGPIPAALDDLIAACTAKSRDLRPAGVEPLIDVFAAVLREHSWSPRDAEAWWAAFEPRPPIR